MVVFIGRQIGNCAADGTGDGGLWQVALGLLQGWNRIVVVASDEGHFKNVVRHRSGIAQGIAMSKQAVFQIYNGLIVGVGGITKAFLEGESLNLA